MENKISLEELLLKELDNTFNKKARLESKASLFIAVISIVLSNTFSPEYFTNQILRTIAIIIGLLTLLLCMFIAFPREFKSLEFSSILQLQAENTKNCDEEILKKVKCAICHNRKKLSSMTKFSKLSSLLLLLLIADFIVAYLFVLIA